MDAVNSGDRRAHGGVPRDAPYLSDAWFRVAEVRCWLRPGLRVVPIRWRQRTWYAVHEPASGRVHRLSARAWAWLSGLTPEETLDQYWRRRVDADPENEPGQGEVIELLAELFGADLLQSDRRPDLAALLERRRKQRKPLWLQNLMNPLSVRVPLWDPDPFLDRLERMLRPVIGVRAWLLWLALVLPAAVLAGLHGDELTANLADRLLTPAQWWLLLPMLLGLKVVHELAHGVMIKHGGGATHEMGVMFLVLFPVPYVDAGAANAMASKWRRAAVGAAGMWIELALCALAVYAWILLEPGFLRAAAHQAILATGIATLLFNANPLLRFDGYFVLSDLIEVPNLGPRSNARWLAQARRLLGERDLRLPEADPGEKAWLWGYAPLALAYRLALMLAIALFLVETYPLLGTLLALFAVAMSIVWPLLKGLAFVLGDARLGRDRPRALMRLGAAVAASAAALFVLPMPHTAVAEGVLWVAPEAELRAPEDGTVTQVLAPHASPLGVGDAVLRIHNEELDSQWRAQQARVLELETRLETERTSDRTRAAITAGDLEREALALADLEQRRSMLTPRAGAAGRLQWQRASDLHGRTVARGELLGLVDRADDARVRAVIGQDDVGFSYDQARSIEVALADRPEAPIEATVQRRLASGEARLPSPSLAQPAGGRWAVDPVDPEGLRTLERVFQLELVLAERPPGSRLGTRALVKFRLEPEPLGLQAWRRLRQLFLSRLSL